MQLWNDVVNVATNAAIKGHFLGSIVYIHEGVYDFASIPQCLVIDGQQRVTTLSLLLLALARVAQEADENCHVSHDDIYESYLVNKHGRETQRYKLLLTQGDKHELIYLLDGRNQTVFEPVHGIKRPEGRLTENYHFFREQIRQSGIDLAMLYQGINKLVVVEIVPEREHDNPQLIFESLNSTGMDLSQADLIRNYVLMGLNNEEQSRLYRNYWYPMEQLVQVSEKRFYLFKNVNNEWIQYGNGKKPWYAISWFYAGNWVREKHRKNEMPLGVGGNVVTKNVEIEEQKNFLLAENTNEDKTLTLKSHPSLLKNDTFEELRKRILNLDAGVTEVVHKGYVAYRVSSNFVSIWGQKKRLAIALYIPCVEVNDPHSLCKDVSGGHNGKATTEISVTSLEQIDDVMDLIRQSFERQLEVV